MAARQTVVNTVPGIGVAGDFCDANPRYACDFGPGGAFAGPGGLTVGLFAWAAPPTDADGAPASITNSGSGAPIGLVPREQQGLITAYLSDAGMVIPAGFGVTVMADAGMLVTNNGSAPAIPGQKAYANFANGQASFAATGTPTTGGTSTASTIAPETFSVTASILGSQMNVSAVGSGTIQPGSVISGTNVITGTTVVSQLSGTAGEVGTYMLSTPQPTIASETITGTWGLLTVGGTVAGSFGVGDTLSGATGTITANAANGVTLTGAGGAGTYATQTQTVSSGAIDVSGVNYETNFYAISYAAPGALVKVSRHWRSI